MLDAFAWAELLGYRMEVGCTHNFVLSVPTVQMFTQLILSIYFWGINWCWFQFSVPCHSFCLTTHNLIALFSLFGGFINHFNMPRQCCANLHILFCFGFVQRSSNVNYVRPFSRIVYCRCMDLHLISNTTNAFHFCQCNRLFVHLLFHLLFIDPYLLSIRKRLHFRAQGVECVIFTFKSQQTNC